MSNLLEDKTFLHDCAALSQRDIESKYAGNGHTRDELRELYKEGRETALKALDEQLSGSVQEEQSQYQLAGFFGDAELLPAEDLPMTAIEAKHIDSRIVHNAAQMWKDVAIMRDRRGWEALGFKGFEEYTADLCQRLALDVRTLERRLQSVDVYSVLDRAGIAPSVLPDSHAAVLDRFDNDEEIVATYKRAREISYSEKPTGKAAQYHRPGRVEIRHLHQAIEEVDKDTKKRQLVVSQQPAKEDDSLQTVSDDKKSDFFSPENRAKALNAQKPLPPTIPQETDLTSPTETDTEPERLSFVAVSRYTGSEGDFFYVRGDDGFTEYEIPVRVADIRKML